MDPCPVGFEKSLLLLQVACKLAAIWWPAILAWALAAAAIRSYRKQF